jgi:methylmalonyl-CoA/ethylmalonyl-CoA epimerase
LVSPYAKESVVYRLLSVYGNAPCHLCYLSDNLEKDAEELSHDGFLVFEPESPAPALENRNVVFLVSSKIGIIELLEKQQ